MVDFPFGLDPAEFGYILVDFPFGLDPEMRLLFLGRFSMVRMRKCDFFDRFFAETYIAIDRILDRSGIYM